MPCKRAGMTIRRALVTGAGGFIGHHLVARLKAKGQFVRGVDLKHPEFAPSAADEFFLLDLRNYESCYQAMHGIDDVYALAADMGGIGYLSAHEADVFSNNLEIDVQTFKGARARGVSRLFYASSACVYPEGLQSAADTRPLKESDAYPAMPQDAYGWEKLTAERLLLRIQDEHGLTVRIARFHNIYGELGTWEGGREKAPAALCRKIAEAKVLGRSEVEIWGDGQQSRSFCHVSDCVEGIERLMESAWREPLNLGQDRMITINALADLIAGIAGVQVKKRHVPGPQGVRGRNSDNSLLQRVLHWHPVLPLEAGMARTYRWIEQQVMRAGAASATDRRANP